MIYQVSTTSHNSFNSPLISNQCTKQLTIRTKFKLLYRVTTTHQSNNEVNFLSAEPKFHEHLPLMNLYIPNTIKKMELNEFKLNKISKKFFI